MTHYLLRSGRNMNSRCTRTATLNHQGGAPRIRCFSFWTTWIPKPALNSLLAWDDVIWDSRFGF
jgi:hypothetical protein